MGEEGAHARPVPPVGDEGTAAKTRERAGEESQVDALHGEVHGADTHKGVSYPGSRTWTLARSSWRVRAIEASRSPHPRAIASANSCSQSVLKRIGTPKARPSCTAKPTSLWGEPEREPRIELTAEIRGRQPDLEAHHVAECGVHEHVPEGLGSDAGLDAGGPALGNDKVQAEARAVVHELAHGAVADRARVDDAGGNGVEHGPRALEDGALAAHHHEQVTSPRAFHAAADRRVEHGRTAARGGRRPPAGPGAASWSCDRCTPHPRRAPRGSRRVQA
jgi:hypothetical protein